MSDPTGFDAVAPALLLTTGRMVVAADPTGFDAGAPAILLTTSRITTDEVADPGSPAGGQQVCAVPVAGSSAPAAPVMVAPTTPAPVVTPGPSGTTVPPAPTPVRTSRPLPRASRTVIGVSPPVTTRGLTIPAGAPVSVVTLPARTLAFTGTTGTLAEVATLALGAALWLRRRATRE